MIGTYNDTPVLYPGSGNDFMDLYRVNIDQYGNPQDHLLSRVEHKNVGTTTIGGGGDASHFAGSTGVYVSPSGELIVYASEHANYGPPELLPGGERGRQTVRFGEYRHREMVRPGSPTMSPSVVVQGPFEIDEGSTSNLFAFGRPPITRAWLQLFEDDGMGLTLSDGIFDTNRWIAIDYDDWSKDNYDNFTKLWEPMNDNAGSWRWFAPPGVTIQVNQHSFNDSDFPGRRKTLVGAGFIVGAPDLNVVRDDNDEGDMDDMVSSVKFLGDAYYSATIRVAWDMDGDGTFETVLSNPAYSAALLDGPSTRTVSVQAQHPTDTLSSTGRSLPVSVEIRIRNVAPGIANLDLVDSFGLTVGVDFPFAIANVEYTAQSAFTDPGRPDHQTARLNFADGTVIQSSSFDLFSDAFGGVTGQVRQRHRFRTSGTYAVNLEVTDDDGGVSNATKSVTVLSPSDVIGSVVSDINQKLATATNQRVIRALRDALDNLGGNNGSTAHNGALDALASGDRVAALGKIGSAIDSLGRAEAAGAGNLSNLKNLLGLAGESIAQGAYQDAVDAIPTPSPGQATQLQRARQSILDGHSSVLNGAYLAAIDLFRDATSRALSLR